MAAALIPFQRVRVSGPSMSPTLRDGDVVIVRHGARIRTGDVVLGAYRSMPRRPVLKRAARRDGDGWWLSSDNEAAGGDSAIHGVGDVAARVIVRFRSGSWMPRRIR